MNDWTFEDFEPEPEFVLGADFFLIMFGVRHREQEPATDLFVVYLWHVTNTENFIEGGYKPRLQEMGPYAYVKQAYKYDIVHIQRQGICPIMLLSVDMARRQSSGYLQGVVVSHRSGRS